MASTITLQQYVDSARAYKELAPVLETAGWGYEPALTIANDVLQKIIAQTLNWKWNRYYIPPFLTVALQQDYVSSTTNMGWMEQAWRIDINNNTNPNAPKPIYAMEAVRDLEQTAYQASPFNISFIPNSLAFMGVWQKNYAVTCGYGVAQTPPSFIQQFIDANGNILFINSAACGLSFNSPGFSGTPITLTGYNPYGITGTVQPSAPPNSPAGTQVPDNTVTWTVADPNGYAMRLAPLPAYSGITWLIVPVYQAKPPLITSLSSTLAPLPDELGYLFREGFMAMCYEHAGSRLATSKYAKWEESIYMALRAGDRERDDAIFYPTESIMGNNPFSNGLPFGPAWPFQYGGGY
jgi:hypothetical protein